MVSLRAWRKCAGKGSCGGEFWAMSDDYLEAVDELLAAAKAVLVTNTSHPSGEGARERLRLAVAALDACPECGCVGSHSQGCAQR